MFKSKEEVIEKIALLAESYTPEWRFDPQEPDVGCALALGYAQMFYRTVQLFPDLMKKNRIALFNRLDAGLLPPAAATGYVTFSLVNERVQGCEVPKGTRVYGQMEEERVSFETMQEIYATPARIHTMIPACDREDFIGSAYSVNTDEEIPLFDYTGVNRQEHALFLCHSQVFQISEGEIEILFYKNDLQKISAEESALLINKEKINIHYFTEEGWYPFDRQRAEEGTLFLWKTDRSPSFARTDIEGKAGLWIRFLVKDAAAFSDFACKKITLRSKAVEQLPQVVYGNGIQCDLNRYHPFGLEMGKFREVAFGSEEMLNKPEAAIRLEFYLEFDRTPLPGNIPKNIQWKKLMKACDLEEEPLYDITVEEVIWEYYNGKGWVSLFPNRAYRDIFHPSAEAGKKRKEITFLCPADMCRVTIDSIESYFIRARILSMKNEYRMNGYYVTPIISDAVFSHEYVCSEIVPEWLLYRNNLEIACAAGKELGKYGITYPFVQTGTPHASMYMGFGQKPAGGPVKILFQTKSLQLERTLPLKWEYYSAGGWKRLEVTDETNNLIKTGLLTITAKEDFSKVKLFEQENYWIRVCDEYRFYEGREEKPVITGIFMNTVKARAVGTVEDEYFRMDRYEEDSQFVLLKGDILSAEVWVLEGAYLEQWVLWECRENMEESEPGNRHYRIDANQGILQFGNGRQGKIPPISGHDNIHIRYKTGGGGITNVPAGTVNKMEKNIGFINQVNNPEDFAGGSDRETTEAALRRNSAMLKHRNRALTTTDFEELAVDNFSDIKRAACFSGYNREGKKESGCITLVILLSSLEKGYLHFEQRRGELEAFFRARISWFLSGSDSFRIIQPQFIEVEVVAAVEAESFEEGFRVREEIMEGCKRFLHPLHGNTLGKGWEIGTFPTREQIWNVISGILGKAALKKLSLNYYRIKGNDREKTYLDNIMKNRYVLPVSGRHQIKV